MWVPKVGVIGGKKPWYHRTTSDLGLSAAGDCYKLAQKTQQRTSRMQAMKSKCTQSTYAITSRTRNTGGVFQLSTTWSPPGTNTGCHPRDRSDRPRTVVVRRPVRTWNRFRRDSTRQSTPSDPCWDVASDCVPPSCQSTGHRVAWADAVTGSGDRHRPFANSP